MRVIHVRGEPVYQLLGGKTKPRLPVYSTTARPDIAKKLGFVAAKVPCPHGPAEGDEGLEKNVAFFRKWREAVGADFPLMLDCYMALTPRYAARLARRLEPLGLKWMEEFLPPDDYTGYQQVREELRDCGVLLTTGEHEYTRYGFRQLIASRCVDILQPDITWLGGMTEARRVVAMAAAEDIPVIPHGSSVYSYHLQYAFNNCPVAEFINLSAKADQITPYFCGLFPDEPLPKDGFIDLPDRPGFGVTLDKSRLSRPYSRSEEESRKQALANINAPALEMKPGDKTCLVTRSKCYLMLGNSESALTDSEAALDQDEDGKKDIRKQKQQTKGYSKPAQQKREEKKERTKPQESGSSKTTKQLLGELFNDKAFLEKLYDSMTTNSTDTDKYIKDRSVDGLEYLNMRADFWRQQKPMYARERDRRRQQQQRSGSGRSRTGEQDPMQYILQRLEEIDEAQANGKYEQSLQKSQKTLKKVDLWGADQVKNKPAVVANLYSCMGNAYLEMGKFKEALECHNKDLALGQAHNIDEAESRALDNLGRTKARMGKYDDAIELWEKKLPKSKSALESTWLYHEIGRCHLELGHYRDAKDFGEKSYAAAQEADDRGWQLHSTVLIAQAEVKCDDLQSAVDSFERGLEIAEELKDKSAQAAIKRALEEVNARIVQGEKADGEDGVDDGRRSAKSDRDEPSPSNAADTKEPAETEEKQPETAEQAESKAKRRQSGWKPKARFAESPFHRGDDHADEERRAATRNRRKTPRPQTASARQRIVDHLNRDEAAEKFFSGPQTGSAADVVYHPFSSNESEKFRQLFGASPSSSPTSQTSSDARIAAFVRSQTTSSDHAGDLGCRPSSAVIRIESEPITETLTGVKDGSDYDLPRARSDTSFILDARARLNRKSSSLVNSDSLIARHRIRFGTLRRPSSSSGSFMWHVSSAEIDGALPSDTVEDLADTDTTNIQDDTDTTNLPADSETTTTDHPTSSPLVSSDASQKDKTNNFPFPKNSASGNRANSSTGPGERSEELPREPSLHPPVIRLDQQTVP
nr:hypothetical protein BaRGS_024372 [Batillaria attramentaria]